MLKKIILSIVFCGLFVNAQTDSVKTDNNSVLKLTLQDALNIAITNNWDMKIAQKEIRKSEEQIDEAYSNAYPRIEFSGTYIRNIKMPVMFIPPNSLINPTPETQTFELGSKNSYDATFKLSQVIYSQKVNTAIKIADDYSEFTKVGTKATKNEIVLNVKKAFYGILLMRELVKVAEQGYEVAKANYDNVALLYKQGVASEYDYLRAEVQLANTQPQLIQAKNGYELSKNYLKNLLSLDLNKNVEIIGEFKFEEIPASLLLETGADIITNNPLVKQLSIQSSMLEKNITIEKSEYYPTLAFFGQYSYQSQDNSFTFSNYKWAQSFLVGLQLSYPIFDGFRRGARIEQAIIEKDKVDLTKRKVEEALRIQILQAEMKMDEAKKRIFAQEKNLLQAEKTLKIAQTRFKSGVGTQLELIDTQAALTFAKTNYAQAVYDYLVAKTEWEFAVSIEQ